MAGLPFAAAGDFAMTERWGIDLMQEAERLAAAGRMLGFLPQ